MNLEEFNSMIAERSAERIKLLHHLAKKIWSIRKWTPKELQNKCMDAWDTLSSDIDSEIVPLISFKEGIPINNLIFGSGSFSTGNFQLEQFERVKTYTKNLPVIPSGIIANKSEENGCNASQISNKFNLPLIEIDFNDWYHQFIDKHEENPTKATRYFYNLKDPKSPSLGEITHRFNIRQDQFHKNLGEKIFSITNSVANIVSARGYNFQFCSNIFKHQLNQLPHINDTHPADLSYIDKKTQEKLYAGWQSGAIQLMMDDKIHKTFHGSLIEVDFMDKISQINSLDEGALLAFSEGVIPPIDNDINMTAKDIQNAMKIIDDYLFCTLEPTGLILLWGITKKKVPVVYQALNGDPIIVKQRAIIVGNKFHSGVNVWGKNLDEDIKEIYDFLFP